MLNNFVGPYWNLPRLWATYYLDWTPTSLSWFRSFYFWALTMFFLNCLLSSFNREPLEIIYLPTAIFVFEGLILHTILLTGSETTIHKPHPETECERALSSNLQCCWLWENRSYYFTYQTTAVEQNSQQADILAWLILLHAWEHSTWFHWNHQRSTTTLTAAVCSETENPEGLRWTKCYNSV